MVNTDAGLCMADRYGTRCDRPLGHPGMHSANKGVLRWGGRWSYSPPPKIKPMAPGKQLAPTRTTTPPRSKFANIPGQGELI